MDSSNPQHSNSSNSTSSSSYYDSDSGSPPSFGSWHHPGSPSPPHTPWSRYDPGSSSRRPGPNIRSSLDSAPPPGFERFPVENNPPPNPQPLQDGGNSSRKRKTRENEKETDAYYCGNSSRKRKSTRENKMDTDTWNDSTQSRNGAERRRKNISNIMKTANPGRKQEINLLNDMILFRNKYGRNLYDSRYDMRQFYKYWTKRRAMFADVDILNEKMVDLHERFVMNYQTTLSGDDIEYWMNPSEVRVYRLSYRIWGDKDHDQDYSSEGTITDESVDSERTISDHSSSTD